MSRIDARNPGGGAPALQEMDVLLVHRDGTFWSPAESAWGFVHFPRLSAAPARLRLVKSGGGPISHGDTIRITTTEPLPVSAGKQVLGTYRDLGDRVRPGGQAGLAAVELSGNDWTVAALNYGANREDHDQDFRICRTAGPGPVAYGDEIYLLDVYDQRIGRNNGMITLTAGADLTDMFTLVDPGTPPLVTSFNPLNQTHTAGKQHSTTTRGYVWRRTAAGQEMLSVETPLPAGSYYTLVQLAPGGATGKPCATIRVQSGGKEIASTTVKTEDYPADDWQRALVPFTTTSNGVVKIIVTAGDPTLWTGAVSITPAGQRPFYVIAHACNTLKKAYDAVQAGANAIEFDITPVLEGGKISFDVYHGPTIIDPFPDPRIPFANYINGIIENGVVNRVALLQFDIKPEEGIDNYDYGYQLASETKRLGLGPQQTFFSVEDAAAANDFYRGVKDAGMFNGARDVSMIEVDPALHTDPGLWYTRAREQGGATFLALGVDSNNIFSPMEVWLEPVSYTTVIRDRHQLLKKVYYWTLDSPKSMRKVLDLNVDGIIVNDPSTLVAMLREQPYAQMYRLATVDDSPNTVYGWSAPAEPRVAGSSAPEQEPQPKRQPQTQP